MNISPSSFPDQQQVVLPSSEVAFLHPKSTFSHPKVVPLLAEVRLLPSGEPLS
ncbi:MAG: hypothetical protein PUD08_01040 [bacterium]|nr:hypothetical protein [bacterium]MDY6006319.1 hypothetical protein [Parabacteroides sp.]